MAQVSGSDIQVLLYHESAWGVDPGTPAAQIAYIQSLGLTANQNLVASEVISGGRGVRRPGAGNLSVAGAIRTEVAPENIGFWLSHLLGAPTTTGVSAPYTHGFVPDALPAGFRVEKDYTAALASKVERFRGCRISSATFTFPQEGFCTAEFQIAGKDHAIITAPLDAAPADPGHAGFTGFEGTVKQGGSPLGYVMSGSLTIDNSLRTDMFVIGGGGTVHSLPEGRCRISGSLSLVFESFALFDLAVARTETTFAFELARGTGAGTAGNEKLVMLVDHADITRNSPPLETEAGMTVDIEFQAFASGTDLGLDVTLMNAVDDADL